MSKVSVNLKIKSKNNKIIFNNVKFQYCILFRIKNKCCYLFKIKLKIIKIVNCFFKRQITILLYINANSTSYLRTNCLEHVKFQYFCFIIVND